MADAAATVVVTVLTGSKRDVELASMRMHDAAAQCRQENHIGAISRSFDVTFSKTFVDDDRP